MRQDQTVHGPENVSYMLPGKYICISVVFPQSSEFSEGFLEVSGGFSKISGGFLNEMYMSKGHGDHTVKKLSVF
jgi:hypothetical protein